MCQADGLWSAAACPHFSTWPQTPGYLGVTEVVFLQVAEAEERVVQTLLSHPQESGRVVFGQQRKCELGSWPLCPCSPPPTAPRLSLSLSLSVPLSLSLCLSLGQVLGVQD